MGVHVTFIISSIFLADAGLINVHPLLTLREFSSSTSRLRSIILSPIDLLITYTSTLEEAEEDPAMSDPPYHNAYTPPPPAPPVDVQKVLSLKQEEYDVNFCVPSAVRVIENEWVKLVPYIVSKCILQRLPFFREMC